jgi:very-short-patch-repair endonuclease
MRKIISYNPKLVAFAKSLRQNMTLGEVALWREIKGKKLKGRFSRQIPINQYIVDFYCKDLKLAIEVDGAIHFEEGHEEKDVIRQDRLESLGVVVLRFSDVVVLRFSDLDVRNNLDWVLEEIRHTIEAIKPTPNPSKEGSDEGCE